jgi:glutathione-regulated potassium-efflux system ancillary protein KefF
MAVILVIHAHPYPGVSRANARLLAAARTVPGVEARCLYDLYPDFDIDTRAEREAVERADLVVWMHPVYWYTAPSLLKHWFDTVLVKGWAYGADGNALRGKACLWAPTTGGDEFAYSAAGRHGHGFEAFEPVVRQTARYCGMKWLEPHVLHGAHQVTDAELDRSAQALAGRLAAWRPDPKPGAA